MATQVYSFKTDLFHGPLEGELNSFYTLDNNGEQVFRPFWKYIEANMSRSDRRLSQFGAKTRFIPKNNQIKIHAVADYEDDEDSNGNIVIFTLNKYTGTIDIEYYPAKGNAWVKFAEGDVFDYEERIANIKEWLEKNAIEIKSSQGGRRKTVKRKTSKRKTFRR